MSDPIIAADGSFGKPEPYTRVRYVNEWVNRACKLHDLTVTNADDEAVAQIIQTVRAMAGRRWDEIYMETN